MTLLAPLAIDADAIASLRDILVDPDGELYPDFTVLRALRDNRQTVVYRDPTYQVFNLMPFQYIQRMRAAIPVTDTDPFNSHLIPEGDNATYQAKPWVRHWDRLSPVRLWRNGVEQTAARYGLTDLPYLVDYPSGRVQFNAALALPVNDWETINATFSYYRVYPAARQILIGNMGSNAQVSIKLSDVVVGISIKDAIDALDALMVSQQPPTLHYNRKLY